MAEIFTILTLMAAYILPKKLGSGARASIFQVYENFLLLLEANYIAFSMGQSHSVWGECNKNGKFIHADSIEDAWNAHMSFIYTF